MLFRDRSPVLSICCCVSEPPLLSAEKRPWAFRAGRRGRYVLLGVEPDHFDLVLMDLHMPGMDGFEATARIRGLDPDRAAIPIIALTANAMAEDRKNCLDAGMDDYLSKPVAAQALEETLARWKGNRSAHGSDPHTPPAKRSNLA